MRTNKLVWIGVAILLLLVIIVSINAINKPATPLTSGETVGASLGATSSNNHAKKTATTPKKVDVKEVTGDTVSESLKNVQVGYEVANEKNKDTDAHVKALEERLAKTENRVGAGAKGDDRVNVVADTVEELKNSLTSLTSQFSTQEKRFKTTTANGYEFSNEALGIDGKNKTDSKNTSQTMTTLLPGYVSVKPLSTSSPIAFDGIAAVHNALNNAEQLGLAPHGTIEQNGKNLTLKNGQKKSLVTPFFTIPARATLMDASAMTAMIGRVPVGGRVQDPFPVKFILGDDNLATNGLSIPGLKGIVFEGVATGNWNLSCVSVELTGATFTFHDGRVQHLPNTDKTEYEGKQEGQLETSPFSSGKSKGSGGDPIGYISSPQGVPCIGGERITDAPQQLATVGILGMAKSYFDAKAAAETTTTTNSNLNTGTAVTGDKLKFAMGATEAGAAQTVIDFYKTHTRDSFDAIVVNPGASVALHITRDLYVDYNINSRKLAYSQGGKHGSSSMD
jgi:integrating conjugative element protein (TIGR03752 family)